MDTAKRGDASTGISTLSAHGRQQERAALALSRARTLNPSSSHGRSGRLREATALGAGAGASAEEAHGWHELEASPAELLADMIRERVARALRRERGAVGRLRRAGVSRAQTSEHRARLRRACARASRARQKASELEVLIGWRNRRARADALTTASTQQTEHGACGSARSRVESAPLDTSHASTSVSAREERKQGTVRRGCARASFGTCSACC